MFPQLCGFQNVDFLIHNVHLLKHSEPSHLALWKQTPPALHTTFVHSPSVWSDYITTPWRYFHLKCAAVTPDFLIFFLVLFFCVYRRGKFRHAIPPREAQCHQFPGSDPRCSRQERKRGAHHFHRGTLVPAQEGAAWLPASSDRPCLAVQGHTVRYGPP